MTQQNKGATLKLTQKDLEELAKSLNFEVEEIELIIPYLLKHNPQLSTVDEFYWEWQESWYRNYDFDEDIVGYEFVYIADYNAGGPVGTNFNTKEELKQHILENYVFKLEDDNSLNSWCLYQITDKLWIERV